MAQQQELIIKTLHWLKTTLEPIGSSVTYITVTLKYKAQQKVMIYLFVYQNDILVYVSKDLSFSNIEYANKSKGNK